MTQLLCIYVFSFYFSVSYFVCFTFGESLVPSHPFTLLTETTSFTSHLAYVTRQSLGKAYHSLNDRVSSIIVESQGTELFFNLTNLNFRDWSRFVFIPRYEKSLDASEDVSYDICSPWMVCINLVRFGSCYKSLILECLCLRINADANRINEAILNPKANWQCKELARRIGMIILDTKHDAFT
jgi:hypothetical protein